MAETWHDRAIAVIGAVHAELPADADIRQRKRALAAARPLEFRATSWGRKVWGKAATQYLRKHGMKPRGSAKLPLSPLEKLMQRGQQ
ncbi:hypothetical protein GCM10007913_12020 [Devosia yakushimensis]|uniref:Uncharacterized protein n=1 Tax=Devosia yakushimensis TaxID=470028 RepID=A0ABQ5UAW7_9HYPH|nr:hypothetical protein GCM10007913_12020 [Devosia yakushimensis]